MTKTKMRKAAGIRTSLLTKTGKDEPAAIESLAKFATVLKCGLDDIVKVTGVNIDASK